MSPCRHSPGRVHNLAVEAFIHHFGEFLVRVANATILGVIPFSGATLEFCSRIFVKKNHPSKSRQHSGPDPVPDPKISTSLRLEIACNPVVPQVVVDVGGGEDFPRGSGENTLEPPTKKKR